jgi:hypothetical protein
MCCIFSLNSGGRVEDGSFKGPERGSSTDLEDFSHLGKVQRRSGWRAKYFVTNHGLFHFRNRKILSFVTVYSSVPFLGLNYSRHWQKDYNLILSYLLTQCICLLPFRGPSIHKTFQNYPIAKMNVRVQFVGGGGGGHSENEKKFTWHWSHMSLYRLFEK